ncbi:RDD family protein [Nesterenkonia alba]|uniref:RDD family protein n=1 Tax=Nesterenkonia alba TaxID=515814 RepID=UPI00052472C9|nr:RDD family protein [Nesterenkonia alba]
MARSVLTGEAVALDLPAVSLLTRAISLLIDLVIYVALFVVCLVAFGVGGSRVISDDAGWAALLTATAVLCLIAIPIAVETLTRGRSVGKLIFGLRLVRDDGGSIRFRHALVRWLIGLGEIYLTLGLVPLISAMASRRSKRLGDVAAGTYAVHVRQRAVEPMMLPVPATMASWTQIADIGRIPDELAARVARLLRTVEHGGAARNMRMLELTAEAMAAEVSRYVSPPAPASSSLEYLTAVMAERRNREYQRLAAQQQRQSRVLDRLSSVPHYP